MQLGFLTDGDPDDVAFAAANGFDCLELALFGDTPLFDDASGFHKALSDHGISLAAVSLFGQNYFDPFEGAARWERLWRTVELTATLGAPIVVFGSGSAPSVSAAVDAFRPVVEEAQHVGLQAAFYNCHWENVVDRPSAWDQALPKLPGVGVKFDPSHPVYEGRDWRAELLAAGPHLRHVHAKDTLSVQGRIVTDPNPGLGDMDWSAFFGLLYQVGYDGAVCIEPHSALYTGPRRRAFLKLSGRYLRQFVVEED